MLGKKVEGYSLGPLFPKRKREREPEKIEQVVVAGDDDGVCCVAVFLLLLPVLDCCCFTGERLPWLVEMCLGSYLFTWDLGATP